MTKVKEYRCGKCDRPISHRGNCLRCNLTTKYKRECLTNVPVGEISKIETFDHREIQTKLRSIFVKLGYNVTLEKEIVTKRKGRIDLFAIKDKFSIGIEIDHSLIRFKSIDKLNTLKPNLAIFILKSRNINNIGVKLRLSLIKVRSIIIYLAKKETQNITTFGVE